MWLVQRSLTLLINGGSRTNKYLRVMQHCDNRLPTYQAGSELIVKVNS